MPTLTPTSEENRIYECTVLYPFPLSQKEEQDIQKEVESIFQEAGAQQIAKDVWGRRGLAYPIGGFDEGIFVVYHYEMDPAKIKEVNEALLLIKDVLRHLMLKPPKHYQIVKFSEQYEEWMKNRETIEQRRETEKEEKIKKHVLEKAKRQAKRTQEERKAPTEPAAPMEEEKFTEELEKLISDDELNL